MKIVKVLAPVVLLLLAPVTFAQSASDESHVVEAALTELFDSNLPYVEHWVVASSTEPLRAGALGHADSAAREDYAQRNRQSIRLGKLMLPERASVADLSAYAQEGGFNWNALESQFPSSETYTARVSRPGFSDESHAVLRVDIQSRIKRGPLTSVFFLAKAADGTWQVDNSLNPVF